MAPLTLESPGVAFRWEGEVLEHRLPLHRVEHPWRWPDDQGSDNVTQELMELVRAGDEPGFRALAGCVMPAEDVEPCWNGAQARIKEGHREAR